MAKPLQTLETPPNSATVLSHDDVQMQTKIGLEIQ